MRPIPATRLGDAHGLLRAIEKRGRLRTDEFVTEFNLDELFPPGLENALGRLRHFISFGRLAGLVKEDRGVVELTEIGKRYVRSEDPDAVFDVSSQQAEWLRRQLRERHMTDSIFHGLAIGLSLLASVPPGTRISTMDFGRSMAYLGRAGWDNENTLLIQGERHLTLLTDLELIDADHRLTATGEQLRGELTLPVHMSLADIAAQLNPGGAAAVRSAAEAEFAAPAPEPTPEVVEQAPAPEPAVEEEPTVGDGYQTVISSAAGGAEARQSRPPIVPRATDETPTPPAPERVEPAADPLLPFAGPPSVMPGLTPGDPLAGPSSPPPPPVVSPGAVVAGDIATGGDVPGGVVAGDLTPPAHDPLSSAPPVVSEEPAAPPAPPASVAPPPAPAPPVAREEFAAPPAPPVAREESAAPPVSPGEPAAPSAPPASVAPPAATPPAAAEAPVLPPPSTREERVSPPAAEEDPAPPPRPVVVEEPTPVAPQEPAVSTPPPVVEAPAASSPPPVVEAPPASSPPPVDEESAAPSPPTAAAVEAAAGVVSDVTAASDMAFQAAAAAETLDPTPPPLGAEVPSFVNVATVRAAAVSAGLRMPTGVYASVAAALGTGKHLLLIGTPGSGKTALALAIARAAAQEGKARGATIVTGDPSAHIVEAASQGRWVVVDELDGADFETALAPLSTFLAGVPVTFPDGEATAAEDWRMVATWNGATLPRAAILRRFALIMVHPPAHDELHAAIKHAAGQDATATAAAEKLVHYQDRVGTGVLLEAAQHAAARQAATPTDPDTLAHELITAYIAPLIEP